MSDDELERLLLDAGVTSSEINRCRDAFPEVKTIVEYVSQLIAGKVAERMVSEYFQKVATDGT